MPTAPTGLRERKKTERYRELAAAARQLTVERGLDEVTVDDIAAAADVSVRTFFNYFSCKEEAIIGIEPSAIAQLGRDLTGRPAHEGPLDALVAVLLPDEDELDDLANRWLLRAELVRRHPTLIPFHLAGLAELETALVVAVAERLGTDPSVDLYPTTVVTATIAVFRSTFTWWHDHDRPRPLAAALREAFAALAAGIAVRPPTPGSNPT